MPLDPAYPWASNPRMFRAAAMPNGDARFGIEGQLVFLCEQRGHCTDKVKYLSRAEAECLRDAINEALHAFDLVKDFAGSIASEIGARACTASYPFRDHRTLAEVDLGESYVMPKRARAARQLRSPVPRAWCEQCETRVSRAQADSCTSRFCKAKTAA